MRKRGGRGREREREGERERERVCACVCLREYISTFIVSKSLTIKRECRINTLIHLMAKHTHTHTHKYSIK